MRLIRNALAALIVSSVVAAGCALSAGPAQAAPSVLGPGFFWGVASSGFQSEGSSPDSNWLRYSRKQTDQIGTAADFYHRYRSDIALAKELGVKVYRISVEWARIQPRPGVWDPAGVKFYDNVIGAIVAAGMRPMITLDHWVYPGWAADRGGWNNPQMADWWLANARYVVHRYAHYNPLWITINEPTAYVMQELRQGGLPPTSTSMMFDQLVRAHRSAFDYIHSRQPGAMVSSNVAYIPAVEPALDAQFLDRVADKLDYVGIDYYYAVSPTDVSVASLVLNDYGSAGVAPDGLYYTLRHYGRKFPGKPLYVVENGMGTNNGAPRPDGYRRADLLRDDVYWLQRAKADGYNVIGYNYWSLTDNYEWGSYTPRFGLYTVNVKTDPTLTRRPTDAVAAYRQITASNGVGSQYRPTRPAQWCSLVDGADSCLNPVR
ncbi:glycoside hydrolase family 1 protein [Jongsikchunia kroppenstedtii]|uniref:glycoside hydrolase family 1 protein n=1 Tax=Jongsikchunia kroppenstedtii TaxID=1121721 RepID=UPI00035D39F0|nr:family 1 glycosylhydrolase [Jongsikchunia kroppenstedtii]